MPCRRYRRPRNPEFEALRSRIRYPESLPISQYREDILAACGENQVVIVAGETGSGKTTQLPKILVELGYGNKGKIGVTQPRRIAATTVADRVAEELRDVGRTSVGYQVRFDNNTGPNTVIKFMTDGILLAETRNDPLLHSYEAIMIDEVHERSLNIDFLLGYMKRLLRRRRSMKLLISSATLDVERFSRFFNEAPVIEVPGRAYPVETIYMEPRDKESDLASDVADAVEHLSASDPSQDILVFLTGERDINETAKILEGRKLWNTEVIPLYARLPAARQKRAFMVGGRRRIVLATNVAETSVTIPGIRAVIDTGLARVKRYNPRTQVEKLHIEPISAASANQRKGRCGRVAAGTCVRLFSEEDFTKRDEFTDPEIKRSSLASVILTMLDLKLGRVENFPFLDPPSSNAIKDGYRELAELGAIDAKRELTRLGRQLAGLSVEPRFGRMLIEGHRRRVLPDVLTVVSGLSADDPRLRPAGSEEESDRAHAEYSTDTSDFAALLRLWRSLEKASAENPSRSRFRSYCRKKFLSYRRVLEWRSLREQLKDECKQLKLRRNSVEANDESLHRSILPGLLNKIGVKQEHGDYRGARGVTFHIHPSSGLRTKRPDWIMAAELVETSRLFARYAAKIEPAWIESAATHICRRRYGPPYWDEDTGFVRAEETVLLYGMPITSGRQRHFGPIDPETSRSVFIEHALVEGRMNGPPPALRRNLASAEHVQTLEAKIRRRNIAINPAEIFEFYDRRLPADVCNTREFKRWLAGNGETAEDLISLSAEDLMARDPGEITPEAYPDSISYAGHEMKLKYRFTGGEDDGVTCELSPSLLREVSPSLFDKLVPGLLPEKIRFLLKGLPKSLRRPLVPLDRAVGEAVKAVESTSEPLTATLSKWVMRNHAVTINPNDWPKDVPRHLTMRFEILDEAGRVLAVGRNLDVLKREFEKTAERSAARRQTGSPWSRDGITDWDFGELPGEVNMGSGAWRVPRNPGLQDHGNSVSLRLFESPYEARSASICGLARLTLLVLPCETKQLRSARGLSGSSLMTMSLLAPGFDDPKDAILIRSVAQACGFFERQPRNNDEFMKQIYAGKPDFYTTACRLVNELDSALETAGSLLNRVEAVEQPNLAYAAGDITGNLQGLFHDGFILQTPPEWLSQYSRYLKAITMRLDRLESSWMRDKSRWEELSPYIVRLSEADPSHFDAEQLEIYRWMLEEWRVSLFAQEIGTKIKVSSKRLDDQWARALGAD